MKKNVLYSDQVLSFVLCIIILAVPCSKPDIFNSDLLNVLEKRVLMKLIRFAVDYARQVQGEVDYAHWCTL